MWEEEKYSMIKGVYDHKATQQKVLEVIFGLKRMISISKRLKGRGVNGARTTAEKMRIKKRLNTASTE